MSRAQKGSRAVARKLPLFVAIAAFAALIAATSSASQTSPSSAKFTATGLTPDSTYTGDKSLSGRLARTDQSLLGIKSSRPVNVMIKYDFDATASYAGGVVGLRATSPRATGVKLALNSAAVKAYGSYTKKYSRAVSKAILAKVRGVTIRQGYQLVYGGVAAQVPGNEISKLLKIKGVAAVQKDTLQHPLDDNTGFIGATNVWPSLGGPSNAGSNVIVGVLDTGIWPEHPMLSPSGISAPPGGLRGCGDFATGGDVAHLGPAFSCNNKLIGAYAKTATYMANIGSDGQEFCNNTTKVCSPRDPEGHGTHTMTTAAGDCVSSAVLYGVERGPVCGIAPGVHVIEYRVCLAQGCFNSDSVAAVQQAIADHVNVINFSISGGAQPYTDPVELAFLDATNAGISVNAAAGNAGPGSGTSDHGGPWTTTVGASTGPRSFNSTLHLTADGGATLDVPGVTLTNGISTPTPVVLASSLPGETALCENTLAANTATGKVVVCARGNNGRVDKGRRVLAGGAAGMILYNQSAAVTDLESDNHYLPAIQTQFNSNSIANFVSSHTNVMATWAQGTAQPSQADVMASFSSRGPTGDWIKPDVTAPGVQVLAGMTPQPDQTTADNGPPGNLYQAIAGTSMASPHAAGVSALVKAVHPSWTPEEIKSALMTSSVQDVVKEDGVTPATPFDDGAGSIRADRAVNPTLVFNESFTDFVAAGTDTLHRIDLNLASVDASTMPGQISTSRTAINVSGQNQVLHVLTQAPAGVTITVGNNNGNINVKAGGSVTFPITISAPNVANGQYFGRITLDPQKAGATPVVMPVAFFKKQGAVTLSHSCSPGSFPVSASSHCTVSAQNLASVQANVDIKVSGSPGLHYSNVSAPASLIAPHFGAHWSGTLSPALAPRVNGLTLGGGEPFGYVPLSALGVGPVAGVGDDTISNFSLTTPVLYGAETYSSIGVVSNGYVVLGGGTQQDIVFLPQHFPNPARPNNVVAPLWTDLNPSSTGAGHLYVATLGAGSSHWTVVDWEGVKNFGNATTHSFEIWFANTASNTGEQITIAYGVGANAGSGDPTSGQNWGAENRDGSSGANLASAPADSTQYSVDLSGPTPGGSVSFGYDATADTPGRYDSTASMTSNLTPGVTQALQTLTVMP